MIPLLHQHRAWLAPALTLIAILLLLTMAYLPIQAKQAKYSDIIQKGQPRIERSQGLIAAAPQLEAQLNEARNAVRAQLYPSTSDDNRLNTELQTRLRELAQQSDLTVGSIRPLPSRKEHGLDIFMLNLNLQGGLPELQNFIHSLQQPTETSPVLRIDSLALRRGDFRPNAPQILNIDISVAALRPATAPVTTP
jgi:hypothetical protein